MPEKHGYKFTTFVAVVVFVASFVNSRLIFSELDKHKLNQLTIKVQEKMRVLGGQNALPPPNAVPRRLLVRFHKNPRFKYQKGVETTIPFIKKKVIIKKEGFRSNTYGAEVNEMVDEIKVKEIKEVFEFDNQNSLQAITLDRGVSTTQAKKELEDNPNIKSVSYVFPTRAQMTVNDPDYPLQWHLDMIRMPEAWDILNNRNLTPVGVAVADSGIAYEDYNDPYPGCCIEWYWNCGDFVNDLLSCVGKNAKYKKSDDFASNIFLPGIDFFDNCKDDFPLDPGGYNPVEHPNDDSLHGTHIASTIAQSTNNSLRMAGIANLSHNPAVKLMPVKIMGQVKVKAKDGTITEQYTGGYDSDLILGLNYIKQYNSENPRNKVRVINLSLAIETTLRSNLTELENAINELYQSGVIIVAASGNGGINMISYPAAFVNVIAVGAVGADKSRAFYSNYSHDGTKLDLVAPGGDINRDVNEDGYPDGIFQTTIKIPPDGSNDYSQFTSLNPDTKCQGSSSERDECGLLYGTSMAVPHVSALAALILAIKPNLSPVEVLSYMKDNASQDMPGYNSQEYGAGLIDAKATLEAVLGPVCERHDYNNDTKLNILDLARVTSAYPQIKNTASLKYISINYSSTCL